MTLKEMVLSQAWIEISLNFLKYILNRNKI